MKKQNIEGHLFLSNFFSVEEKGLDNVRKMADDFFWFKTSKEEEEVSLGNIDFEKEVQLLKNYSLSAVTNE